MPYTTYNGPIGIQSEGALVLTADELSDDMLIVVVNAGPLLTVTTLGALKTYINGSSGLSNNGGLLVVSDTAGWPTTSGGAPGSLWSNGGVVSVVPGYTPVAGPAVFYGSITASQLLAFGAIGLPVTPPTPGSGQLWVLNDEVLVA